MALATLGNNETFTASADLNGTNDRYTAVSLHTVAGQIVRSGAAASNVIGFTDDSRAAGEHILIATGDNVLARAGAAIAMGAALAIGANGTVITAVSGNPVVGYAQEAATAENQVISITFRGMPASVA